MGLLEEIIARDQELEGHGRWLKGSENSSLVVDTEKQIFFWNSKGIVGDVYVWLTKVKGMNYETAKEYLKSLGEFTGSFIHNIKLDKETVVYPKLVDVFYENGQNEDKEYWYKRGINDNTIHRFKLGYFDGFYTIPIYQDGLFKNFQMRKDKPEKRMKYYYDDTSPLLFNSDILKLTDTIVIVEGPTSCLRLYQEGTPCISHTAGAMGWQPDWYRFFIHQKKIIVLYDNDSAGKLGAIKVAKNLGVYRTYVYNFEGYVDHYDVGDFFVDGHTRAELGEIIKTQARRIYE